MTYLLPIAVDKGRGPAVVLLHGLGTNYKSWTFALRRFDYTKMRVIAFDLLGFGDAPKPSDCAYTPKDHAAAVIRTLDKMKIQKAVLAGHSMGCIVAIEVARERPDLVKSLALFGPPLYAAAPKRTLLHRLTHTESAYFTVFSFLKKNPEFTIVGAKGADKALPALKGMEITEETWPAFKASLNNSIMQFKSYRDLQKLKTPTLLVGGLLDFFIIRKNLRHIARRNRRFVRFKTVLGPHEITPLEGKTIAKLLQRIVKKQTS